MDDESPDQMDIMESYEDEELERELWFGPPEAPFRFQGE